MPNHPQRKQAKSARKTEIEKIAPKHWQKDEPYLPASW